MRLLLLTFVAASVAAVAAVSATQVKASPSLQLQALVSLGRSGTPPDAHDRRLAHIILARSRILDPSERWEKAQLRVVTPRARACLASDDGIAATEGAVFVVLVNAVRRFEPELRQFAHLYRSWHAQAHAAIMRQWLDFVADNTNEFLLLTGPPTIAERTFCTAIRYFTRPNAQFTDARFLTIVGISMENARRIARMNRDLGKREPSIFPAIKTFLIACGLTSKEADDLCTSGNFCG